MAVKFKLLFYKEFNENISLKYIRVYLVLGVYTISPVKCSRTPIKRPPPLQQTVLKVPNFYTVSILLLIKPLLSGRYHLLAIPMTVFPYGFPLLSGNQKFNTRRLALFWTVWCAYRLTLYGSCWDEILSQDFLAISKGFSILVTIISETLKFELWNFEFVNTVRGYWGTFSIIQIIRAVYRVSTKLYYVVTIVTSLQLRCIQIKSHLYHP